MTSMASLLSNFHFAHRFGGDVGWQVGRRPAGKRNPRWPDIDRPHSAPGARAHAKKTPGAPCRFPGWAVEP